MAAGDATAADVPGKYDVVINGKGYCLLDSLEESIPFRTHRAVYGQTAPFVERQNVSNSYGDNSQDFFLTIRQRDWSLGEQQKFFRPANDGRYWHGAAVDVTIPGQVMMRPAVKSVTFAGAVRACCPKGIQSASLYAVSTTNLYEIDETGSITDRGAHGLGVAPATQGICTDGRSVYMSSSAVGTVGVRKWNGAAFSTFSATGVDNLEYLNNTLYGTAQSVSTFYSFDTGGTATSIFQWKEPDGTARGGNIGIVRAFGGQILILWSDVSRASELWVYAGVSPVMVTQFPPNFYAYDMDVLFGIAFISGSYTKGASGSSQIKPAVLYYQGGQIGEIWRADTYMSTAATVATMFSGNHPSLDSIDGGLVWNDDTRGQLMLYNPAVGGVQTIGAYTVAGTTPLITCSARTLLHTRNQVGAYVYPDTAGTASTATLDSSLIDFDSSLLKQFRGVKVEFDAASDGDGGSVDVSYQVGSVTGSWTSLRTAAVSGTEYTLTNVSGHAIAIRVTLNKGTSTLGPTLKSLSVRGAPEMPIYNRGEYIIDCTNTETTPRQLRDDSYHPLSGYDQVANLVTARNSTTPISVTDKVNGTYAGFVDVNDQEGFDVYEIHPAEDDRNKPGSYVVRLTIRGV